MSARTFFDTNVLVYILQGRRPQPEAPLASAEQDANRKAELILSILERSQVVLGVQVFNELCNVSLRRGFPWAATMALLQGLEELSEEIAPLTHATHRFGLALRQKYRLQLYDSMLLAAALETGCSLFLSEDMQDGQVIEGMLTIRNPFAGVGSLAL